MALLDLQHMEEVRTDVEHGRTCLSIALVLANSPSPDDAAHSILDEISQHTHLPPASQAYFIRAIEAAHQANYVETLVPALYEYGQYLYRAGRTAEGLEQLAAAKSKALQHQRLGEARKIQQMCAALGASYAEL